jgi:hypothetical protein
MSELRSHGGPQRRLLQVPELRREPRLLVTQGSSLFEGAIRSDANSSFCFIMPHLKTSTVPAVI